MLREGFIIKERFVSELCVKKGYNNKIYNVYNSGKKYYINNAKI